jgi:hypothetical protein
VRADAVRTENLKSDESQSGQAELWVRPFDPASPTGSPAASGKWMVSRGGAITARWRGDGKELFYTASDGSMMSVEVNTSACSQALIQKQQYERTGRFILGRFARWQALPPSFRRNGASRGERRAPSRFERSVQGRAELDVVAEEVRFRFAEPSFTTLRLQMTK